ATISGGSPSAPMVRVLDISSSTRPIPTRSAIPTKSIPVRSLNYRNLNSGLFDRVGPRLGHLTVLLGRAATDADGADNLAAGDDRHPALERVRSLQCQDRVAAAGERILEDLCRPAEQCGRACLSDGVLDRAEGGVVHALEVDQEGT